MANRSMQQKELKIKRRNRFAVFSGATSTYDDRGGPIPFTEDAQGNTKTKAQVRILVGQVSLSKQVINTGRGPDNERMAQYYNRLRSFDAKIPDRLGISEPERLMMERYKEIINETKEMRICLENNGLRRLDLFFNTLSNGATEWFFVLVDHRNKEFKKSRLYGSKKAALLRLRAKTVTWVEHLPKK